MFPQYIEFTSAAERAVPDSSARIKAIAAAVALSAATRAPLPSSQVENVSTFFSSQVLPNARSEISTLNENIVFDVRLAMEMVRAFWMTRYNAAHPVGAPLYGTNGGFFAAVTCANQFFSQEQMAMLDTHAACILQLSVSVTALVMPAKVG